MNNEQTKEEILDGLKKYNSIQLEIESLLRVKSRLKQRCGDDLYPGYHSPTWDKIGSNPNGYIDPALYRDDSYFEDRTEILEYQTETEIDSINKQVEELKKQSKEIIESVNKIEDSTARTIARLHYLSQMSWTDTAEMIERFSSADSCRKYFFRKFYN